MAVVRTPNTTPRAHTRRVVCELDASSEAAALLDDALTRCEELDADLVVVWVLEPRLFASPVPGSAGAVGTFGLPHVLYRAVERAKERGISATSVVRIGARDVVLRTEAVAAAVADVFRLEAEVGDGAVRRCNGCGCVVDLRAPHHCPRVHLRASA